MNTPPPFGSYNNPLPPYNATNFTAENPVEYTTLQHYAKTSPNYPWNAGTDAQMIYRSNQNISYFTHLNQQTAHIKDINGTNGRAPYPTFKSEAERLMYRQGLALTASRNVLVPNNPASPAGVPCSTIYNIIYQ